MKSIIIGFAIAATTLTACNNGNNKTTGTVHSDTSMATQHHDADTTPSQTAIVVEFPTKEILADYLQLKNALAKDNGKDAAAAGTSLAAVFEKIDPSSLPADQQKTYADLKDDIKEHSEHIGGNPGKIEHQREHFVMLSKDVADLVKTFGNGGQTLYKDFCPMANDGKGAIWLSEVKEIKNPYQGTKMLTCGSVKETIK